MNDDSNVANPPRLVWWPTAIYLGLLVVGIPWYWPTDNHMIVFGMPGWVIVAIFASFVGSIFTAWLLWPPWPGELSDTGEDQQNSTDEAN